MREIKFRALGLDGTLHYFDFSSRFGARDEGCDVFYVDGIPLKIGSEQEFTGLKDKNGLEDIYECDIIGVDGLKKGNVYENRNLLKEESNLIIQGFGTSSWETTNKKAMERGCRYAE